MMTSFKLALIHFNVCCRSNAAYGKATRMLISKRHSGVDKIYVITTTSEVHSTYA